MTKEQLLPVHYLLDGKLSVIQTKTCYTPSQMEGCLNVQYEVSIDGQLFRSKSPANPEFAIKHFQQLLPKTVSIACCQSCRYGNFCPFGNQEDEIFCLRDLNIKNRNDICTIFTTDDNTVHNRSHTLLDYCEHYKPICQKEQYTYNDWND